MDCVVGLGANLGDRAGCLQRAVEALGQLGTVTAVSALYESDPVGGPPQPRYFNAAVRLATWLGPAGLLHALLGIERSAGRERRVRWGPRTLDLDLLWIRDVTVRTPELVVPHPRLTERQFALVPLLEVAPEAIDPSTGLSYASIARALPPAPLDRRGQLAPPLSGIG